MGEQMSLQDLWTLPADVESAVLAQLGGER